MKYKCNECSSGCVIETPNDTVYSPYECPSFASFSDWRKVEDTPQKIDEVKPEQPPTAPACQPQEGQQA